MVEEVYVDFCSWAFVGVFDGVDVVDWLVDWVLFSEFFDGDE